VVALWRNQDPPGRFVTQTCSSQKGDKEDEGNDQESDTWHDIGDAAACQKASQALREQLPKADFMGTTTTTTAIAAPLCLPPGNNACSGGVHVGQLSAVAAQALAAHHLASALHPMPSINWAVPATNTNQYAPMVGMMQVLSAPSFPHSVTPSVPEHHQKRHHQETEAGTDTYLKPNPKLLHQHADEQAKQQVARKKPHQDQHHQHQGQAFCQPPQLQQFQSFLPQQPMQQTTGQEALLMQAFFEASSQQQSIMNQHQRMFAAP